MHLLTGFNAWTRSEIFGPCVCFSTAVLDSVQNANSVLIFLLIQSKWKTWLTGADWWKRRTLPSTGVALSTPHLVPSGFPHRSSSKVVWFFPFLPNRHVSNSCLSVKLIIWNRFFHMLEIDTSILWNRFSNVLKLETKDPSFVYESVLDDVNWRWTKTKRKIEMQIFK